MWPGPGTRATLFAQVDRTLARAAGIVADRQRGQASLFGLLQEKESPVAESTRKLPEWPQLHLLATNLSQGCLCSFNRDGLWMIRREIGQSFRID